MQLYLYYPKSYAGLEWRRLTQDSKDTSFSENGNDYTDFDTPDDVVQGFEDLTDHIRINYQGEVDNLLEYFEDTYIGRHRRNAPRRTTMFPVVLWNMFHRSDEEIPRTNNSV